MSERRTAAQLADVRVARPAGQWSASVDAPANDPTARLGTGDVSVLLPTFNRANYIGEAIASILGQDRPPREIIVIDDGSTDGTREACAAFGPAVRYLQSRGNFGKTAAINRGLSLARGEFVWVMDDDDIAPPNALADLQAPLLADPGLGFSFERLQKFRQGPAGERSFGPPQEFAADARRLFVRLMEDCFITGQPCVLVRRTCFEAISPLDEQVRASVDYNILLQLARRFEAVDVGTVVLWQRQHDGLRGPEAMRYAESERVKRWMESDARLIAGLFAELDVSELRPWSGGPLSPAELRRALFQKATIAARKDLWPDAIDALCDAVHAAPELPLSDDDRLILANMLGARYGIDAFIETPQTQRALRRAAGRGRLGDAIRTEIASRLTYWIKCALQNRDFRRFKLTLAALIAVAGVRASEVGVRPALRRMSARLPSRAAGRAP